MRLFAPTRTAAFALALWFGAGYCFLGCEMQAFASARPDPATVPAQPAPHHHDDDSAASEQQCADGCCKKPGSSQPAQHSQHGAQMECCQAMASIALAKSKPPKISFIVIALLSATEPPAFQAAIHAAPREGACDMRETYLQCGVLRI